MIGGRSSRTSRSVEWVAKPAALAALIGWVATTAAPQPWLVAALVCSLAGDVFLMLPADLFRAGVAAFLLAHFAYLVVIPAPLAARLGWWAALLVVTAPIGLRVVRAVPSATLRGSIVVYALALTAMTASAIASGSAIAALGATLFLASDTLIAWDRFVAPQPWGKPVIMVTYHLAQLALASALRFA